MADMPEGRVLMEEQLYGILIQMLTYMQAGSKKLRRDRQRECIDAALANGVHFGRKQKFVARDYIDVFRRVENGEISKTEARELIGTSPNTFARMYRELKQSGLIWYVVRRPTADLVRSIYSQETAIAAQKNFDRLRVEKKEGNG